MRRLIIALTLAGAALRFATLDLQSFWFDEAVTVRLLRDDFFGMLDRIPGSESTPPLYYVVAWPWAKLFGTGEVGLRSLSALAGTATVPVAYAAAERLVSRRVGVAVAALAALSPLLVWYSQEARSYALLGLLGATSVYGFARLVRSPDRTALWLWAGSSALALATHYFAVFLVAGEALWLVLRARRPGLGAALAAIAAAALALLPLAIHQDSLDLATFIRGDPLGERLIQVAKQLLVGFDAPVEPALVVIAAGVALAGVVLAARLLVAERSPGLLGAAAVAAVALAAPLVVALAGADYLLTRNLIALWLPAMTFVAAGLLSRRLGVVGVALLCAIGLAGVVGTDVEPLWQRDNGRGIVEALGPPRVDRAVVLTPAETGVTPFLHYDRDASRLGPAGATVAEIALVSVPKRTSGGTHPPQPPRPARPQLAGFREVRRTYADNFTVIVFARRRPAHLTPAALGSYRLLPKETAGLVLERPVSAGEARARRRRGG